MDAPKLISSDKYSNEKMETINTIISSIALYKVLLVLKISDDEDEGGFDAPLDRWDAPLKPVIEKAL